MEDRINSGSTRIRLLYSKARPYFQIPIFVGIILIYICIGILQYYFVRHQLYKNVEIELHNAANQISNELVDNKGWKIANFRRSMDNYPNWHIIDTSGLIIDVKGILPIIIGNITPLEDKYFQHPQTVFTSVGEHWRVFNKHLDSGYVVLGIRQPSGLVNEDSLLYLNASLLGNDLHKALKDSPKEIDDAIEIAIISSNNHLLYMWGGTPLKSSSLSSEYRNFHYQKLNTSEGVEYLLFNPISLKNEINPIGVTIIYKNISDIEAALQNQVYFNMTIISVAVFFTLILYARGLRKYSSSYYTTEQALTLGENEHIEFKETYAWNVRDDKEDLDLRFEVIKAIAGFSNKTGGQVFIGIRDDLSVPGIERDLRYLGGRDKLGQHIVNTVSRYLGRPIMAACSLSYSEYHGNTVCIIKVPKSKEPVYFRYKDKQTFFIRIENTTREFEIDEAVKYIHKHWTRAAS